ncbi:MAG TPA: recombinase RecJ, partial [Candidatus Bathyarchaeota archaeon]|nr:recombinase RecJ [Candidatus Bathyarchaeota archaeon]
ALVEAEEAVAEYRRAIGAALDWAVSGEGLEEGGLVYVLRGGSQVEEAVIGVVSGILLGQGILDRGKPIVGLAQTEEGQVKVSARTVPELAEKGIHLGNLIQKAAEKVGGDGGGHDIAAGAYLPVGTEEEFIEAFEELLAQALNQG